MPWGCAVEVDEGDGWGIRWDKIFVDDIRLCVEDE
jgi:hypothetical protein